MTAGLRRFAGLLEGSAGRHGIQGPLGRRNDQGFTLVELLVVLAILAVIATISLPNMRRPNTTFELKNFARQMTQELKIARATAKTGAAEVAFVLEARERWIQVDGRKRINLPQALKVEMVTALPLISGRDNARLVFFPDGSSTGGRITIAADASAEVIDIDWLTGLVGVRVDPPR